MGCKGSDSKKQNNPQSNTTVSPRVPSVPTTTSPQIVPQPQAQHQSIGSLTPPGSVRPVESLPVSQTQNAFVGALIPTGLNPQPHLQIPDGRPSSPARLAYNVLDYLPPTMTEEQAFEWAIGESLALQEAVAERLRQEAENPDPIANPAAPPVEDSRMPQWRVDAQARVRARSQIAVTGWGDGLLAGNTRETAMSIETSRRFAASINRLDLRYPQAVPRANEMIQPITQMIANFNPGTREFGQLKKQAAIRFMQRVQNNFRNDRYRYILAGNLDTDLNTGLSGIQTLSLAWFAARDRTIFTTLIEQEDRLWGLIEAFAQIQRAHNDNRVVLLPGGHTITDAINFDNSIDADEPSCPMGTFKRLLEHLENAHPDVTLNEAVPAPADLDAATAIQQKHTEIFANLSEAEQQAIVNGFPPNREDQGLPAYTQYAQRLRAAVRVTYPGISDTQYERVTNYDTMQTFLDAY